jgi:putative membrane protein
MTDRLVLSVIGLVSAVIVAAVGYLLLGHDPGPGAPDGVAVLPALNATLNATGTALLAAGWVLIRRRHVAGHRACMLGAVVVSTAFLVSYVIYHSLAGSRPFTGQGWIRAVYFPILISHIVLAAGMVPFVLTTLYRALRGDFTRHARLARWTLPVWLYVSVTGVVVYWLLYRVVPAS